MHGKRLAKTDITACHRIGFKGKTIVWFVNRQFTSDILYNGKKLKNKENFKNIYINNSFCKEFGFLNYQIRKAQKAKKLFRYKVKNGINLVQATQDGEFCEITHRNDLVNLGIEIN